MGAILTSLIILLVILLKSVVNLGIKILVCYLSGHFEKPKYNGDKVCFYGILR